MGPVRYRSGRAETGAIFAIWALAGLAAATLPASSAGGAVGVSERPPVIPQFAMPEPIELSPQALELQKGYRDIFHTFVTGDRSEAVGRAAALETQALAANPGKALEWLSQADGGLLGTYLQAEPDCALPLVQFYQRLVLTHASRRSYQLLHRALHVADGLFEQMTLDANSQTARLLTADAYSGFAADLLGVPAPTRALEMLGRGVVLAPDDDDANIALAVLLLRDRRANDAQERLDHVLDRHPANREARLRRVLMRSGVSADGRAAQELEKLALSGDSDWIALVAAQERVRRQLAADDWNKSIAFLNRALERFPGDSSLRVALAFATARANRRAEAYLSAQSALNVRPSRGEGARRIFAELPIRLLREQAARATAAADQRLPRLAAALSSASTGAASEAPTSGGQGSSGVPGSSASAPQGPQP
ncbi:MAG: hypothetical protein ABIV06_01980 [Thermoanaerobaculia bacterium]